MLWQLSTPARPTCAMDAVASGAGSTLTNTSSRLSPRSLSIVRLRHSGLGEWGRWQVAGLHHHVACRRRGGARRTAAAAVAAAPGLAKASNQAWSSRPAHLTTSKGTGSVESRHFWNSSTYSSGKRVGEEATNCPSLM